MRTESVWSRTAARRVGLDVDDAHFTRQRACGVGTATDAVL